MIKLAFRTFFKLKRKFIPLILILTLSFSLMMIIASLSAGFKQSISTYYTSIEGGYLVAKGAIDPAFSNISAEIPSVLAKKTNISIEPEIWQLASTVEGTSPFNEGMFSFVTIGGMNLKKGNVYFDAIVNPLDYDEHIPGTCLISSKLSERYNKKAGDTININGKDFQISAVYSTGSFYLDIGIVTDQSTARELLHFPEDRISCFFVRTDSPSQSEDFKTKVEKELADYEFKDVSTYSENFKGVVSTMDNFSAAVLLVVFFFISLIFYNAASVILKENVLDIYKMIQEGWVKSNLLLFYFIICSCALITSILFSATFFTLYAFATSLFLPFGVVFPVLYFLIAVGFSFAALSFSLLIGINRFDIKSPSTGSVTSL